MKVAWSRDLALGRRSSVLNPNLVSTSLVDNQDRLALRFGEPLVDPDIARTGVAIVLCMGGVLFLVIMGA